MAGAAACAFWTGHADRITALPVPAPTHAAPGAADAPRGGGTASYILCPDCGLGQAMPRITAGKLRCRRCRLTLEQATGRSLDATLACAIGTLALLVPANFMDLLRVSAAGLNLDTRLYSGPALMWRHGWVLAAIMVAAQAMVLPFIRFALLAAVLTAVRIGKVGRWTGPAFRWTRNLDLWAMPDVYLVGLAIGYSRLAPYVPVRIGDGGWCMAGAGLLTLLTRAVHDKRRTWRAIAPSPRPDGEAIGCPACDRAIPAADAGRRCPRCGVRVWRRKPGALRMAIALIAAGYVLYPIANAYPLAVSAIAGERHGRWLYTSVLQLFDANLYVLAAIIFVTSIAIPFAKLLAMTWLFVSIRRRSGRHLVAKTQMFRLVDELGRWSNADVYTLAVYAPLVQVDQLANIRLDSGLPALLYLVVLTMLASQNFDQRLVWDAGGPHR